MLKSILLKKITHGLNKILSTDPWSLEKISELAPQTMRLTFTYPSFDLLISFDNQGLNISHFEAKHTPTVWIKGSPFQLLQFSRTTQQTQMLMDKKVEIKGDLELLMQLQKIQKKLLIDWEELLSEVIGDFAANRCFNFLRKAQEKTSEKSKLLHEDTLNYLLYEAKLLPNEIEVKNFYEEIKKLRRDLERLELRIKREK